MGCANVLDGDVLYKHNPTLASFPVETFSKETRNPLVKSLPGIRILPACVMQTIRTAMRSTWLGRTADNARGLSLDDPSADPLSEMVEPLNAANLRGTSTC